MNGRNFARALASPVLAVVVSAGVLGGCAKPPDTASTAGAPTSNNLDSIPVADPAKYPKRYNKGDWQNPHLIVRRDDIGFVDLANHEIHILQPEQIPAELTSLPAGAWPYGRVVLITEVESKTPTEQLKADLRKNRGLLIGTLKDLHVQIYEP